MSVECYWRFCAIAIGGFRHWLADGEKRHLLYAERRRLQRNSVYRLSETRPAGPVVSLAVENIPDPKTDATQPQNPQPADQEEIGRVRRQRRRSATGAAAHLLQPPLPAGSADE